MLAVFRKGYIFIVYSLLLLLSHKHTYQKFTLLRTPNPETRPTGIKRTRTSYFCCNISFVSFFTNFLSIDIFDDMVLGYLCSSSWSVAI